MFLKKSIRSKILVLFLVTTLSSIAVVGYLSYRNARNALQDELSNELSAVALLKEREIEDFFDNRKKDIRAAQEFYNVKTYLPILTKYKKDKTNPEYLSAKERIDYQLKTFQPTDEVYTEMELIDPSGEIVYVSSERHQSEVGLTLADRIEFREGKNGVFMGDIFYDEMVGEYEMYMTAPITDYNGNFIGEILFETSLIKISELMRERTGLSETLETYLVGRDMLMRSQSRFFEDSTILKTVVDTKGTKDCFEEPHIGESQAEQTTIYEDYRGARVLGAHRLLKEVDWCLLVEIDEAEAFAPVKDLLLMTIEIMGIATVLSTILALVLASTIINPLGELVEGTERIGKGDLDYRIEVKKKDEMGWLSNSFNQMTEDLKRSKEKIEEYSRTLEQKVEERTRELKRSNQLKDLFMDIMRHDLINPISVIRNLSEIMGEGDSLKDTHRKFQMIKRNAEKLEDMIESASELAKIESTEVMDVEEKDLAVVIKEVIKDLKILADEKGIKIENNTRGEYLANVNPFIQDVFSNLLSNAIKYSPEKSEVVVDIGDEGKDWKIMVKDNGEGVPDEYKESIFERFTRIEKKGVKGSGLGLAIVKRVVDLHKGEVWIEDNPEGGSIFYVNLPKKGPEGSGEGSQYGR
ncbi:MAG: ATP-binding protein [Candidatus Hydrothermarchaeales archaeon]